MTFGQSFSIPGPSRNSSAQGITEIAEGCVFNPHRAFARFLPYVSFVKKLTSSRELNLLAAQIVNFIEYWGFKNIHGMIWTPLYLSPVPLSSQELITRLKVSQALISHSIRDLAHSQLITQTTESMERKNKFYTANPDVFNAIRSVLETREVKILGQIQEEFQLLRNFPGPLLTVDHSRLLLLGGIITGANQALAQLIQLSQIDPDFFKNIFQFE